MLACLVVALSFMICLLHPIAYCLKIDVGSVKESAL